MQGQVGEGSRGRGCHDGQAEGPGPPMPPRQQWQEMLLNAQMEGAAAMAAAAAQEGMEQVREGWGGAAWREDVEACAGAWRHVGVG